MVFYDSIGDLTIVIQSVHKKSCVDVVLEELIALKSSSKTCSFTTNFLSTKTFGDK